jgi:FKBP-type peptidyl-prolyl cis-trans isomerase
MQSKLTIFFLTFFVTCGLVSTTRSAFKIENQRDVELLEHFFRYSFTEEEYGYVLEGIKPISIRNHYYPSQVPLSPYNISHTEKEIAKSLLIFEAIPILKKMNLYEKNIVLKIAHISILGANDLGVEVQFINVPLLEKTIEENISLFKYILGATVTSKELVHRLAFSNESLSDTLQENHTLIGIVLGYGNLNSVIAGRQEHINFQLFSRDFPPYTAKAANLSENYAFHYFNAISGNDFPIGFRTEFKPLIPMPGFVSTQEEMNAIDELHEELPICLNENPRFEFAAFKGNHSNQNLFDALQKAQKNIQKLLVQKNFLEIVLTKILNCKPNINCEKINADSFDLSFFKGSIGIDGWKKIVSELSEEFDEKGKNRFFQAFINPPGETTFSKISGSSEATLKGLQIALENLEETTKFFENLSNDSSLTMIVPKQLYYRTITVGSRSECDCSEFDKIRLRYCITDLRGNILSANYDAWLSQSHLICGFSHGLKGMCIGEKREIYIDPSLGYGVLTTMPPCMGFIATVELLNIDKKYVRILSPLTSTDCHWIKEPKLLEQIKNSIEEKPLFIGWFYHQLMNKIEGKNAEKMRDSLRFLTIN